MTKEEKTKAIAALKLSAPVMAMTSVEFADYIKTINKIIDWLEHPETVTEFADRCQECGKSKPLTENELFKLIRRHYGIEKEKRCFITVYDPDQPGTPIYIATDWGVEREG